jgi:hypothetical protein
MPQQVINDGESGLLIRSKLNMMFAELYGTGGGAINAIDVTFAPTGNLSAADVQSALAEVDADKADLGVVTAELALKANTTDVNTALALKASLDSPALTGTPTVPTAAPGTNTTQAASTAFVTTAVSAGGTPAASSVTFTPTGGIAANNVQTALAEVDSEKAPLASPAFTGTPAVPTAAPGTNTTQAASTAFVAAALSGLGSTGKQLVIACSDETTALTAGTAKTTFRMPYALTVTGVRASLTTAQASGSIFTVDINEGGVSILSTKLTIDNTEKTSTTAATAAVVSDAALADDAEITVDIDQIGDGTAKGLKITLIGT